MIRLLVLLSLLALAVASPGSAAPTGALTQALPPGGCISDGGVGGCTSGVALGGASGVAVSADGRHVYVGAEDSNAVTALVRDRITGALASVAGTGGCVSETGSAGLCEDGAGLVDPRGVAISNDGRHVYVVAETSGAVSAFRRNRSTGALTQLDAPDACISNDGSSGDCVDGVGLAGAWGVTISPDGRNVYVAAVVSDAVAVFARNKTSGALSQLPGTQGCVSNGGAGGCASGTGLNGAWAVAVSPDGKHVYVASRLSDAVAVFSRDKKTGALTQLAGLDACVRDTTGTGDCTIGTALDGARDVAVSPDGKYVYVASIDGDALAVFARNKKTGALTQLAGQDGCVSQTGHGGACATGVALLHASSIAITKDGRHLYVGSEGTDGDAVAVFARNKKTGVLSQLPGQQACISETGTGGDCADGTALNNVFDVAASRDGKHVYAASAASNAIAILNRQ